METHKPGPEFVGQTLSTDLWFKGQTEAEINSIVAAIDSGLVKSTVRLGDRTESTTDPKGGYRVGSEIDLKIQKADGSFLNTSSSIRITAVEKKPVAELLDDDLNGATLDGEVVSDVLAKLEKFYGRKITNSDTVTVVKFEKIV